MVLYSGYYNKHNDRLTVTVLLRLPFAAIIINNLVIAIIYLIVDQKISGSLMVSYFVVLYLYYNKHNKN